MANPAMAKIMVVDDEPGMRKSVAIMLRREGYDVTEVSGGTEAVDALRHGGFDLIIADLRMGPVSGMDLLRVVKQEQPRVEVILMTAFGTLTTAVEAIKLGAFDFVGKPFQNEELLLRVRNALDKLHLTREVARLEAEVREAAAPDGIVGDSRSIRELHERLTRFAAVDSTVLITGESGTGKELAAKAIHARSARAHEPFVSVSCAALPDEILENELFGHVRGAFSGAVPLRKGLFEEANRGTFFLDEIGEASPRVQAKLLRVLEERVIRPLGSNRSIRVDVRVVAATNRDLDLAVKRKEFRDDLHFRLNVLTLHVPPLRERRDDIPLLVNHLLQRHASRLGRYLTGVSPAAMAILVTYDYPGNVRELSNVVERAVALASGVVIDVGDLPEGLAPPAPHAVRERPDGANAGDGPGEPSPAPFPRLPAGSHRIADMERQLIVERIQARQGNIALAAEDLGISRTTLWRRMKEYGIHAGRPGGTADGDGDATRA
jgi:two-component system, NtrC family, response regulator HydG